MRDILFRGKRIDNGEWVFGDLLRAKSYTDDIELYYIFTDAKAFPANEFIGYEEIIRKTVGQFTGLTDKNGKRVFEGDIFKTKCNIGVIRFRNDQATFGFEIWWRGFPDDFATFYELGKPDFEIIGNIHDNPELLEVE